MNYDANTAAFGIENQQRMQSERITIIGSSLASEYLILNLAGLGIQNIQLFDYGRYAHTTILGSLSKLRGPRVERVQDALNMFAPYVDCQGFYSPPIPSLIESFNPTKIIVAQQIPEIEQMYEFKNKKPIWTLETTDDKYALTKELKTPAYGKTISKSEDISLSATFGSLIADEIRKEVFTYPYEEKQQNSLELTDTFFATKRTPRQSYQSVCVIGAGGIGTYTALALTLRNAKNIDILDFDSVEETNLNRQFFYAQYIGKNKAESLAKVLTQLKPFTNICGLDRKLTTKSDFSKYDAIFCCVDNFKARLIASDLAEHYQKPLFEAGCNTTSAIMSAFLPNKTRPISHQRNLKEKVKQEQKQTTTEPTSCTKKTNPSVVIPNCVAGSLLPILHDTHYDAISKQVVFPTSSLQFNSLSQKKFTRISGGSQ